MDFMISTPSRGTPVGLRVAARSLVRLVQLLWRDVWWSHGARADLYTQVPGHFGAAQDTKCWTCFGYGTRFWNHKKSGGTKGMMSLHIQNTSNLCRKPVIHIRFDTCGITLAWALTPQSAPLQFDPGWPWCTCLQHAIHKVTGWKRSARHVPLIVFTQWLLPMARTK